MQEEEKTTRFSSIQLKACVQFEKELFLATIAGVRAVAAELARPFKVLLSSLTLVQIAFLASCLGALVVGLLPWIEYRVTFQSEEVVTVGSSAKVLFLLPALAGVILSAVEWRHKRLVLLVVCAAAGLAFAAGVVLPNPVHTSIMQGDFHVRWVSYGYVPFLVLIAALSGRAFEKTTLPAAAMLQSMLAVDSLAAAPRASARPRSGRAG